MSSNDFGQYEKELELYGNKLLEYSKKVQEANREAEQRKKQEDAPIVIEEQTANRKTNKTNGKIKPVAIADISNDTTLNQQTKDFDITFDFGDGEGYPASAVIKQLSPTEWKVRFEALDSPTCGGSMDLRQSRLVNITIINYRPTGLISVQLFGNGELQDPGYDTTTVNFNGTMVARQQSAGGQQECAMGDSVKEYFTNFPMRLSSGNSDLNILFDTIDENWHVGLYSEVLISIN